MDKITFLGAGSTVFAKNVLGDCITTDAMREFEYALYDIDHQRLEESYMMLSNINRNSNDGKAKVVKYADRLDALRGAKYVINCIQVGGYDPCTITDFEIPKKYGLRQTIGDTHGIGGMFRSGYVCCRHIRFFAAYWGHHLMSHNKTWPAVEHVKRTLYTLWEC